MNPVSRFEGAEFAPNSPTDAPVSVATITVYRKGAQVAENVMFLEQETHDLAVEDAGDIAVDDDLALWGRPLAWIGSRAVMLIAQPSQLRLPTTSELNASNGSYWLAGDLAFDEESERLMVRTSEENWMALAFVSELP